MSGVTSPAQGHGAVGDSLQQPNVLFYLPSNQTNTNYVPPCQNKTRPRFPTYTSTPYWQQQQQLQNPNWCSNQQQTWNNGNYDNGHHQSHYTFQHQQQQCLPNCYNQYGEFTPRNDAHCDVKSQQQYWHENQSVIQYYYHPQQQQQQQQQQYMSNRPNGVFQSAQHNSYWTNRNVQPLPQQQQQPMLPVVDSQNGIIHPTENQNVVHSGNTVQTIPQSVNFRTAAVPPGWQRCTLNGAVFYISPSGNRLASLEEVAVYVQRDGTCKCGLPCPLRLNQVFSFDPSVLNATWPAGESSQHRTCCRKRPPDAATVFESPQPKQQPNETTVAKKTKLDQLVSPQRKPPCPNVDVRLLPAEQNRPPVGSLLRKTTIPAAQKVQEPAEEQSSAAAPSFFDDPSGYLAQQTVLVRSSLACSSSSAESEAVSSNKEAEDELIGDLLDCIPDSMDEVIQVPKETNPPQHVEEVKATQVTQPPKAVPVAAQQQQQQQPQVVKAKPKDARSIKKPPRSRNIQTVKPQVAQQQLQMISVPGVTSIRAPFQMPYNPAPPASIHQATPLRPLTLVTANGPGPPPNFSFSPIQPLLTTRPALASSGQLVHVVGTLTTPTQMVAASIPNAESSAVPVFTIGSAPVFQNNNNPNKNTRTLTRTGKKKKSAPQTVASILQGAQMAALQQQQQHHQQHQQQTQPVESPLIYNVQNIQQYPQVSTLTLMADGKTYVVVNTTPSGVTNQQPAPALSQWVVSPRNTAATFQTVPVVQNSAAPGPTLITTAPQPVNLLSGLYPAQIPGTTIVVQSPAPTSTPQQLLLQDGTLLQTDSSNLLTSYGGVFIRCPTTPQVTQQQAIFTNAATVATSIPVASLSGTSPDSSVPDGVTSSSRENIELVTCGEATPPQTTQTPMRKPQPSPVVQSSLIDSCVQEEDADYQAVLNATGGDLWNDTPKRNLEFNNNRWLSTNCPTSEGYITQNITL